MNNGRHNSNKIVNAQNHGQWHYDGLKKTKARCVIIRCKCRYLFYISCSELLENRKRINENVRIL